MLYQHKYYYTTTSHLMTTHTRVSLVSKPSDSWSEKTCYPQYMRSHPVVVASLTTGLPRHYQYSLSLGACHVAYFK